ncbi:MAG: penicillin-binding protein 2 [Syntrophomonadaceae bacterium]|nr:penicillin-binding protein 2 [Syntrophomonadaceae bacterium]
MKANDLKINIKIYAYIVVFLLGILGVRLAIVQLFNNDIYQTQAKENRIRLVAIKAPRGEIYANNGEILASNKLVYTLSLTYMEINDYEQVSKQLVNILKDYYPEITLDFIEQKVELQKDRLFEPVIIMRDIPWELVVKLEESRRELLGVTVTVEPLRYYPQGALSGHILGYIHSINPDELSGTEVPRYNIASLIGKSGVEKYYEQELRGKDGARRVEVDARGRPVRELVTLEPESGNNLYLTLDMELQKVMEKSMAGTLKNLQSKYPKAQVGSAVVLNVKTGEVLAMCSDPPMFPDDWKGNLSSARLPYYIPQTSDYDPLNPGAITNRAIQSTYPPGSTFKPVIGMAVLEKGLMDPEEYSVNCGGAYWIAPYIKCTGVHGNVNYYSAMAVSCNTYFQEMGRRAAKDEIIRVAGEMGLGSKTGVDLPEEKKGLLPSPAWKKEYWGAIIDRKYEALQKQMDDRYAELLDVAANDDERRRLEKKLDNEKAKLEAQYESDYKFNTAWQAFDTFNMSIGQGYNDYSVLQLANYIAAIANGGNLMRPQVVQKIVSHDNKVVKQYQPELIRKVDIKDTSLEATQRAMLQVAQPGGTAYFLFSHFPANIKVAAKTGTAETGRKGDDTNREFHGVFVAFAPFDDPEIAFAGVVEYGQHGSESAGLVARAVFEQYFGLVDHLAAEKLEQDSKTTPTTKPTAVE